MEHFTRRPFNECYFGFVVLVDGAHALAPGFEGQLVNAWIGPRYGGFVQAAFQGQHFKRSLGLVTQAGPVHRSIVALWSLSDRTSIPRRRDPVCAGCWRDQAGVIAQQGSPE